MNVTYSCSRCHQLVRHELDDDTARLDCPQCGHRIDVPANAVEGSHVRRCVACPSTDLFNRKDFPQRVGVAIVVFGIVASSITWGYGQVIWTFGILFGTALVDVVLYAIVGEALMCYRCHAQYRDAAAIETHGPFDLETHEKHRQSVARMAKSGHGT